MFIQDLTEVTSDMVTSDVTEASGHINFFQVHGLQFQHRGFDLLYFRMQKRERTKSLQMKNMRQRRRKSRRNMRKRCLISFYFLFSKY